MDDKLMTVEEMNTYRCENVGLFRLATGFLATETYRFIIIDRDFFFVFFTFAAVPSNASK